MNYMIHVCRLAHQAKWIGVHKPVCVTEKLEYCTEDLFFPIKCYTYYSTMYNARVPMSQSLHMTLLRFTSKDLDLIEFLVYSYDMNKLQY